MKPLVLYPAWRPKQKPMSAMGVDAKLALDDDKVFIIRQGRIIDKDGIDRGPAE